MIPRRKLKYLPILLTLTCLIFLITHYSSSQGSTPRVLTHNIRTVLEKSVHDWGLDLPELFILNFSLVGHHYDKFGIHQTFTHKLSSSIVHSFSPYTENRFREIILDPRKEEQRIYANSPAILMLGQELLVVMRIWLEKEKYQEHPDSKPSNDFNDNYLYTQRFDRRMKPTNPGEILGLPTPRQWIVGDGPIEPRLFVVNDKVYLSYNTGVYTKSGEPLDSTFIWDYFAHKTYMPNIMGGSPMEKHRQPNKMIRDKHWTPFISRQHELYMVYNLDPLRIMKCSTNFTCKFTHFEGPEDYTFYQNRDCLRGGTPWSLYQYPYYIAAGHSTLFKDPQYDRVYTVNILVMRAEPTPRTVYSSGPIQIHHKPMTDTPIVRHLYIQDPFFFPVSLLLENKDSIIIGGHINDYSAILLRVRGLKALMDDIIRADKQIPAEDNGPPLGTLHNSSRQLTEIATKFKFFSH